MELVEGEDLSALIDRGAIPIAEALPIAKQIADALEAAHELGIVHRDLKPANIKVRPDGTVKVLDFGLAKAMAPVEAGGPAEAGPHQAMNSPTFTQHATQMGMIVGTAAYMAPEQARGKAVDKRADIWAFGVILFEMLSGKRLFEGDTISDVLAAVLRADIDWRALPASVPSEVRRLLVRCLDREPKNRLHDIADARIVIDETLRGGSGIVEAPAQIRRAPRWLTAMPWAVAALAIVTAIGISWRAGNRPAAALRPRIDVRDPAASRAFPDGVPVAHHQPVRGWADTPLRRRRPEGVRHLPALVRSHGDHPHRRHRRRRGPGAVS